MWIEEEPYNLEAIPVEILHKLGVKLLHRLDEICPDVQIEVVYTEEALLELDVILSLLSKLEDRQKLLNDHEKIVVVDFLLTDHYRSLSLATVHLRQGQG